jgi:hypothetical protein
VHQAITLIAVILRVFSKLAMENATHPFSRVQNAAYYSRAPDRRVEGTAKNVMLSAAMAAHRRTSRLLE